MSMSAKALKAALAMNNTIVAQAEKIAEMQRVIDGAVREGVYCKDGHWWNELCRLSTYTPNNAWSGLVEGDGESPAVVTKFKSSGLA